MSSRGSDSILHLVIILAVAPLCFLLGWHRSLHHQSIRFATFTNSERDFYKSTAPLPFINLDNPILNPGELRAFSVQAFDSMNFSAQSFGFTEKSLCIDSSTAWVKEFIASRARGGDPTWFTAKISGHVFFGKDSKKLEIHSRHGYALKVSNAANQSVTFQRGDIIDRDDSYTVAAEPGWYQIEIEFTHGYSDPLFLWVQDGIRCPNFSEISASESQSPATQPRG